MITLNLSRGILILEDDDDTLLDWEHKLFFTITIGYQYDNQRFIFKEPTELPAVLRDTISYLRDEGLDLQMDEAVERLWQHLEEEQDDFKLAQEAGIQFPNQKQLLFPPTMVRKLKPYQLAATNHLLRVKYGANFSVPGSGKTTSIYAAYDILKTEGIIEKLLVIGPRSSFLPWEEEFSLCFGYSPRSARLTGAKSSRLSVYLNAQDFDPLLCTYQTASNDIEEIVNLCKRYRTFLVIDESHNIKRAEGGVWAEAMLKIAPFAERRAILSGTPMPNGYLDLWSQMTFLWPGKHVLGELGAYRYQSEDVSSHPTIRQAIRPFFYRVTKPELDLPPYTLNYIYSDTKPYQSAIYHALSVRFLQELSVSPEDQHTLREWRKAKMVRLIQAASNPTLLAQYSEEFNIPPLSGSGTPITQLIDEYPRYETPAKIERAVELVTELLGRGEKVVVWTSFIHNIKMLERLLSHMRLFTIYGAIPRDASEDDEFNREQQIRQFKELPEPAVLLANPAACAESISLHKACHHAVYLDRTFNCGQYLQSLDRIHRVGLDSAEIVSYHILVAKDTVDETIDRRLREKEDAMMALLDEKFPMGSLETPAYQMTQTEAEEKVDFEATIEDLKAQLETT